MANGPLDRLRDRLPVNEAYNGVVADAYDSWMPVDDAWPDEVVYRQAFEHVEGPILELGCGTGRPLIRWLSEGVDVQGLDASTDMLRILQRHAAERGLHPVVHHGSFAPLTLDASFGAIVCLAGTFMLIDDLESAREALASYREHLFPGGMLGLSLGSAPPSEPESSLVWKLRRTGTDDAGVTYIVHEAIHTDRDDGVTTVYDRLETYDVDGRLVDTTMRRHRIRSWERSAIEEILLDLGFHDVQSLGDGVGWVTLARRA